MWWHGPKPRRFSASRIESVPVRPKPVPIAFRTIAVAPRLSGQTTPGPRRWGEASARPAGHPCRPLAAAAGEGVEVGGAVDDLDDAGGGILPERPALARIDLGRVAGDRAQPEVVAVELPELVVAVEVDGGVDERPLAVAGGQELEEAAGLGAHRLGVGEAAAGARLVVPLDV